LKRLDNISRSPLFAHYSETLSASGQATIRAYGAEDRFIKRNLDLLDYNNRVYYLSIMGQRWLSLRLESLASFLVFFVVLFGVIGRDVADAGMTGLAITYALQVTGVFNWAVKQATEVETFMSCVERILHYICDLKSEEDAPEKKADAKGKDETLDMIQVIPNDWPRSGTITFDQVVLRYRQDLPTVLNGVSFSVKHGQKIGIVGRTGTFCLFALTIRRWEIFAYLCFIFTDAS
jgi:ABC-type multidrug transport system fused ATPase/permease subunit